METLRWNMTIAVLWIGSAVAMSAHMILMSLDPIVMKKATASAGSVGSGEWLLVALFWLVPLWMAFAAISLRASVNRRLEFAVGGVFTALNIWHFFICGVPVLKGGPFEKPVAHHVLLVGSTVLATALIVRYAWRWPKEELREKRVAA